MTFDSQNPWTWDRRQLIERVEVLTQAAEFSADAEREISALREALAEMRRFARALLRISKPKLLPGESLDERFDYLIQQFRGNTEEREAKHAPGLDGDGDVHEAGRRLEGE